MKKTTKEKRLEYHDRPEWSYSQMKVILDSGIDYAVAAKRKMLPQPEGKSIDLGTLVHSLVLGGEERFVISPYENYRTKAAREWRDEQKANGLIVLTQDDATIVQTIASNIIDHPFAMDYILGRGIQHEVEMSANLNGVHVRGKADALRISKDRKDLLVLDLKTTAQFDKFKWNVFRNHYDLQCAVYSVVAAASQGWSAKECTENVNYIFCIAETVVPFRVQFAHASAEFMQHGMDKLNKCLTEILEFGDKDPNFLLEEIIELGDFSY